LYTSRGARLRSSKPYRASASGVSCSRQPARLRSAASATAVMVEIGGGAAIEPFTLHDLRRTAATGMAGIGIAPHVVDKILNHVSGAIRGVAAIYNRHAYIDERKAAIEAWSRRVESLVDPAAATSNVLAIKAAN
jgi:integrase